MNKKNILYCSLAMLLIVVVAITANQKSAVNSTTYDNMSMRVDPKNNPGPEDDEKKILPPIKVEGAIFADSDKYSKTDLNRALMYQKKSWAKDETINEAAWEAAQNSGTFDTKIVKKSDLGDTDVAKNNNPKIETQQKPTPVLNTTNAQDSKDNSAMLE